MFGVLPFVVRCLLFVVVCCSMLNVRGLLFVYWVFVSCMLCGGFRALFVCLFIAVSCSLCAIC